MLCTQVLVDKFSSRYRTCDGDCRSVGTTCKGAWEEENEDCNVKHNMACGQTLDSSDAICECNPARSAFRKGVCLVLTRC